MSALVSIIIPIYNLEKYIAKCLNSIILQTYKELEIICIDDGSVDDTAEIIKSFAEKDCRIKYIRRENAGVSAARNFGLEKATGEYIMFVDGDDGLHFRAVEILLNEIQKNDCYCAVCDFKNIRSFSEVQSENEFHYESCCDVLENQMKKFPDFHVLSGVVWAKLIRADCAKRILFDTEFSRGEDSLYISELFTANINKKISYVRYPLYYYYCRSNSASTKQINEKDINSIYAAEKILKISEDSGNEYLRSRGYLVLFSTIKRIQTDSVSTPFEKRVKTLTKSLGKKYILGLTKQKDISAKERFAILFEFTFSFRYSLLYKILRIIVDPTMYAFYFKRKKS